MNRTRTWTLLCAGMLAVAWCTATPCAAETKPAGQKPAAKVTQTADPVDPAETIPEVEPAKVKELATKAGITPEQVTAMRTSGLGWGEIKIAISMAQRISSATTPASPIGPALDGILASRLSGMGWGQIAQANGFKLGEVMGQGHGKKDITAPPESVTPSVTKSDKETRLEKPEKPTKPEKPEKPERLEKPEKPEHPTKPEKPERPKHHAK